MFRQPIRLVTSLLLILSLLGTAGVLLSGCGLESPESITIGVVNLTPVLDPTLAGFKAGMAELGYIEGDNVAYIYEGPVGSIDKLEGTVQGLLAADADLILSMSTPASQVAQRLTRGSSIPVVFAPVTDPIAADIVPSLRQPGGNVTGVTSGISEGRRLEWLLKIVPDVERVFVPYNPDDTSANIVMGFANEAASILDVEVVARQARGEDEIRVMIETIPEDIDAIFLLPDNILLSNMNDFVEAAFTQGLPLSVPLERQVEAGALFSFGISLPSAGRQAARLADQILQGVKPADLPVETTEVFPNH